MSQAKTRVNHSVCIGVTGGMGCGKSTVSKLLAEQGFILIDSDALIRDKILHLPEVVAEAVNKYSDKILNSEGKIDRSRLATKVFANDADLRWLEELTHPRLFDEWRAIMRPDPKGRWVIEVPLLFEKQLENWFDFIVCVASSPDQQLARLEQLEPPRWIWVGGALREPLEEPLVDACAVDVLVRVLLASRCSRHCPGGGLLLNLR